MRNIGRCHAVVIVLCVLGSWGLAADAPSAKSDMEVLEGTWVCVATNKEGNQVETYVGVRAVIEDDYMTWYFPTKDGTYSERKTKFRIDPTKSPKHFDWWYLEKPEAVDLRLYSLEGGALRWATNLDFKTRPETFESARWQFTMRRVERVK